MELEERIKFLMEKAKFKLSDEELIKFTKDLKNFNQALKVLDSFDLDNIEETRQPFDKVENYLRDDNIVDNNNWNFIKNASNSKDGYIFLENIKEEK